MKNHSGELGIPVYTYKKVVSISRNRLVILCKEKTVSISFADCIHNYAKEMGSQTQGIGTRDVTELKFTFYTNPKTVIVWKKPEFFRFGVLILTNNSISCKKQFIYWAIKHSTNLKIPICNNLQFCSKNSPRLPFPGRRGFAFIF